MTQSTCRYIGRFAPSPTGPLHRGSVVAALASYLDARANQGLWLVRIEDIDPPREIAGASESILKTLTSLGMISPEPIQYQHTRSDRYQAVLNDLIEKNQVYPCACSRREINQRAALLPPSESGELIYPGTCRNGLAAERSAVSWRLRVGEQHICWQDRPAGLAGGARHDENLANRVGDFSLKRSDGLWTYQFAVVIDDMDSGTTHIVRGDDLASSTARQIHLFNVLGAVAPSYLHLPLVRSHDGKKLSKQNRAKPIGDDLNLSRAVDELNAAMKHLGLPPCPAQNLDAFWRQAVVRWRESAWMN